VVPGLVTMVVGRFGCFWVPVHMRLSLGPCGRPVTEWT
jgi:hypothetical protein